MDSPRQPRRRFVLLAGALTMLGLAAAGATDGQPAKVDVLRIGTSVGLTAEKGSKKEESALETLKVFIKEETGLPNEIVPQKSWQTLAEKMAKGNLHLGVFQGYEFAWAQEKFPDLKPLALAIRVYRYPIAYVVTQRTNQAKDFAGLEGQSLSIPAAGQRALRLYVERASEAAGKPLDKFFAKVTAPEEIEDAIDDVVDGTVQATVVDRAALEAYKRRKPGRFNKLKQVAHSPPFPPPLVACYGDVLDEATRARIRDGLVGANRKEKGETMLTLFRLTAFEPVPEDFGKVLAESRKNYPPDKQ